MKRCQGENLGSNVRLPQYSSNKDDLRYYEKKADYVKNPGNKSLILMNQNRKYWAKNDKILLADKSREPAP